MGRRRHASAFWIYHIDASIAGGGKSRKEVGEVPYVFPSDLRNALMNGCWGTEYKETDPCYSAGRSQRENWELRYKPALT